MDKISMTLFVVSLLWLLALTGITVWIFIFFKKLTDNVGTKDNLLILLGKIADSQKRQGNDIKEIKKVVSFLEDDGKKHIQKIGLVRYNPFAEMGGDHSFSISVLNGHDTGYVLTTLHTRDRTRIYVKEIENGKSKIELSEFEKKAISQSKKK